MTVEKFAATVRKLMLEDREFIADYWRRVLDAPWLTTDEIFAMLSSPSDRNENDD